LEAEIAELKGENTKLKAKAIPNTEALAAIVFDIEDVRSEVSRRVLGQGGGWVTILFTYVDLKASGTPTKVALTKYRKIDGVYQKKQAFNLPAKQFQALSSCVSEVCDELEAPAEAE
jgi:hypothetical protein